MLRQLRLEGCTLLLLVAEQLAFKLQLVAKFSQLAMEGCAVFVRQGLQLLGAALLILIVLDLSLERLDLLLQPLQLGPVLLLLPGDHLSLEALSLRGELVDDEFDLLVALSLTLQTELLELLLQFTLALRADFAHLRLLLHR